MADETQSSTPKAQASSGLSPAKKGKISFEPATYSIHGLEEGRDEHYINLVGRSYTLKELEDPAVCELLHLLGWPHITKTNP